MSTWCRLPQSFMYTFVRTKQQYQHSFNLSTACTVCSQNLFLQLLYIEKFS
jgi:hypothetical protein